MTMTTCMMTYPPARCTLPVGHDGPHATRDGYGWHDSDDMGGGVTAALIEKEAEPTDVWRRRAEKAEKERDEARRQLHDAQQDADMSRTELESEQPHALPPEDIEAPTITLYRAPDPNHVRVKVEHPAFGVFGEVVHLPNTREEVAEDLWVSFSSEEVLIEHPLIGRHARALDIPVTDAEPRPLTPADITLHSANSASWVRVRVEHPALGVIEEGIPLPAASAPNVVTDEMVERAYKAWEGSDAREPERVSIRRAVTAALTPEPQRPEGAEKIEELLRAIERAADMPMVADYLARNGVRVTTEEDR